MKVPLRYVADARSGEKLYLYNTNDMNYVSVVTEHHTQHDSFDGFCVCQHLIMRAIRRYGMDSPEQKVLEGLARLYADKMKAMFMAKEKAALKIVTVFDICKHGCSLCRDFLRD